MKVIVIAAMTPSGVIGRTSKRCETCHGTGWEHGMTTKPCTGCAPWSDGRIPCNDLPWGRAYPEIDARLDALTMGHAVVMDEAAWKSLPPTQRPLHGRRNVIVSSYPDPGRAGALAIALAHCREEGREIVFIISGARLFAEALPIADELDLTLIGREYAGDVVFPLGGSFYRLGMGLTQSIDSVRCGLGSTTRSFECVSRQTRPTNADLTFTKWVRR